MKGAMAEPLVSTKRPPNAAIMIRIGSSQNFLRTRRNKQNSRRNDSMGPFSELVLHRFGTCLGRAACDPVGVTGMIGAHPKRILAERAHEEADRQDRRIEYESQHHWAHDLRQEMPQALPDPVEWPKGGRPPDRKRGKSERNRQRPPTRLVRGMPKRRHSEQRKRAGDHEAERAIGRAYKLFLAVQVLVHA